MVLAVLGPNFLRVASRVLMVGLPLSFSIWYRALVDILHMAAKTGAAVQPQREQAPSPRVMHLRT